MIRGTRLSFEIPVVMGIINTTPDSFSDGGKHRDPEVAISAGLQMVRDGARILDVGGESTRPDASTVPSDVEIARVLPVVEALAAEGAVVSIDTSKAEVAASCIEAGAAIVNDVTAFSDPDMAAVCAEAGVGVVLMHMLGTPRSMQTDPTYADVVSDVAAFLSQRANAAVAAGVDASAIALDPGIGFGKTVSHDIELMTHVSTFGSLGYPVVIGASRKKFLGSILEPVRGATLARERDGATAATVALAVAQGASILRVHNVRLAVDVAVVANAMVPVEGYEQENHRT